MILKGKDREKMKETPVLYLAGDSISQSWPKEKRPQAGWGEYLLEYLCQDPSIRCFHREDCPFLQEQRYEGRDWIVDNCAVAGRSSKTFREEGRLEDISRHLKAGDYLLIQFGHNDACVNKKERFVPAEEFGNSLKYYIIAACEAGAVPVLLTPVSTCTGKCDFTKEAEAVRSRLEAYAGVMKKFADENNIFFIDMYKKTEYFQKQAGEAEAGRIYIEDGIHLTQEGARLYAAMAAETLNEYLTLV